MASTLMARHRHAAWIVWLTGQFEMSANAIHG
jgi:hypothetical protein